MDGLIKRMGDKLKDLSYSVSHSKVVKMLAAGALSLSMALSFAACNPSSQITPNPPVINPGTNPGTDPTNPGTNPGTDPTNPGTNPGTDPTNPGTEDPYAKYSPALQAVLKSNYYNKQIYKAKNGQFGIINGYPIAKNVFGQIPYKFLEDEGYNVDELKTTDVEINALTYTYEGKENELYNLVNVSYNTKDRYISQYLLKYKISDQEYKDLKMLINGNYIQIGLFVQELNNFHTPEVVSHYNIGYDAYNKIIKDFSNGTPINDMLEGQASAFALLSVDSNQETNSYTIGMRVFGSNTNEYLQDTKTLDVKFNFWDGATYNNEIFDIFSVFGRYSDYSETSNISMYKDYPGLGGKDLAI